MVSKVAIVMVLLTVLASSYGRFFNTEFRFHARNFPHYCMRHRFLEQMVLEPCSSEEPFLSESTFVLVPGLAGTGVSFRSKDLPNHYIRHQGFECFLQELDGSQLFRDDATWIPREALSSSPERGVSFETVNFPGYYLRHQGFKIRINKLEDTELFRDDATWF